MSFETGVSDFACLETQQVHTEHSLPIRHLGLSAPGAHKSAEEIQIPDRIQVVCSSVESALDKHTGLLGAPLEEGDTVRLDYAEILEHPQRYRIVGDGQPVSSLQIFSPGSFSHSSER